MKPRRHRDTPGHQEKEAGTSVRGRGRGVTSGRFHILGAFGGAGAGLLQPPSIKQEN